MTTFECRLQSSLSGSYRTLKLLLGFYGIVFAAFVEEGLVCVFDIGKILSAWICFLVNPIGEKVGFDGDVNGPGGFGATFAEFECVRRVCVEILGIEDSWYCQVLEHWTVRVSVEVKLWMSIMGLLYMLRAQFGSEGTQDLLFGEDILQALAVEGIRCVLGHRSRDKLSRSGEVWSENSCILQVKVMRRSAHLFVQKDVVNPMIYRS
ncbi:hypothetical protein VTL71DRAFT_5327 [Oculimacula yallundae]|uniref:Uncharacterized protein n=1 Tax=Oculimacula yallundae TaxID=86028 RepID=A0ABR4C1E3_9HELO